MIAVAEWAAARLLPRRLVYPVAEERWASRRIAEAMGGVWWPDSPRESMCGGFMRWWCGSARACRRSLTEEVLLCRNGPAEIVSHAGHSGHSTALPYRRVPAHEGVDPFAEVLAAVAQPHQVVRIGHGLRSLAPQRLLDDSLRDRRQRGEPVA